MSDKKDSSNSFDFLMKRNPARPSAGADAGAARNQDARPPREGKAKDPMAGLLGPRKPKPDASAKPAPTAAAASSPASSSAAAVPAAADKTASTPAPREGRAPAKEPRNPAPEPPAGDTHKPSVSEAPRAEPLRKDLERVEPEVVADVVSTSVEAELEEPAAALQALPDVPVQQAQAVPIEEERVVVQPSAAQSARTASADEAHVPQDTDQADSPLPAPEVPSSAKPAAQPIEAVSESPAPEDLPSEELDPDRTPAAAQRRLGKLFARTKSSPPPSSANAEERRKSVLPKEKPASNTPRASLWERLRGKKAQPAAAEPQNGLDAGKPSADPSSSKKPERQAFRLGSSKSKPTEKPQSAPPKGTSPRAKFSFQAREKRSGVLYIETELEAGKSLFWECKAGFVTQVETPEPGATIVSCSVSDLRFPAPTKLSDRKASETAQAETGDRVSTVNASKSLGALYATRSSRLDDFKPRMLSGIQLVDVLQAKGEPVEGASFPMFVLPAEDGSIAATVIYFRAADGGVYGPQVTLNPESTDFALSQYAARRKVPMSAARAIQYDLAQLIAAAAEAKPYPLYRYFFGVPTPLAAKIASSVVVLTAVGALAALAFVTVTLNATKAQLKETKAEIQSSEAAVARLLSSSIDSYAELTSVNVTKGVSLAQQVWMPGSRVQMTLQPREAKLTVVMPITQQQTIAGLRQPVTLVVPPESLHALIEKKLPPGCTKSGNALPGSLNEFHASIVCKIDRPDLGGYGAD